MTQTITNCNAVPVGKKYPVADLRSAPDVETLCKYVDAGHPIATDEGAEVRLFTRIDKVFFSFHAYINGVVFWEPSSWTRMEGILETIKLAPLAYKDGRPLHVGDEIEVFDLDGASPNPTFDAAVLSFENIELIKYRADNFRARNSWRFANAVESV